MMNEADSLYALFELILSKAPEYVKLLTADSEEMFDEALDNWLERAVIHLEKNRKNFTPLDEVGLTGVLIAALSVPGLTVTQEAHSNGHVDIIIEANHCTPMRRKLGEAKIYNGPAYHISGLEQLLGRYTTGREGRGVLIVYVRQPNIAGLFTKIRKQMDAELPFEQQGRTVDHKLKWSFLSRHAHSCGETLDVSHVGCNLFT